MVKENFCGVCAAIPLAMAGAGALSYTATGEEYENRKTLLLIGGAVFVVVSVFLIIKYYGCKSCR